jgi:hypothetical protein
MALCDDFYEDDEPIEKIQQIRRRPPDLVTGPRNNRGMTVFLMPSDNGEWITRHSPLTWMSPQIMCDTAVCYDVLRG